MQPHADEFEHPGIKMLLNATLARKTSFMVIFAKIGEKWSLQ
jgi:hypothetical protein